MWKGLHYGDFDQRTCFEVIFVTWTFQSYRHKVFFLELSENSSSRSPSWWCLVRWCNIYRPRCLVSNSPKERQRSGWRWFSQILKQRAISTWSWLVSLSPKLLIIWNSLKDLKIPSLRFLASTRLWIPGQRYESATCYVYDLSVLRLLTTTRHPSTSDR